jgi:hypothetical protein
MTPGGRIGGISLTKCRRCSAMVRLISTLAPIRRTLVVNAEPVHARLRVGARAPGGAGEVVVITRAGTRIAGLPVPSHDPTGSDIEGYAPHRCQERPA